MAWDPALLRKFNATGHFRLLNQVRSELKANPIKRAAPSAADQANSRGVATGKPLDLRSQGYGRRRSSGPSSSPAQASPSPTPPAPLPVAPLPETTAVAAAEPSPWGKRRSSASAASRKAPTLESGFQRESNPPTEASSQLEGSSQLEASSPAEAGSRSFRDRLNAIQMR
jgi:hypothetical protein